MAPLQACDSVSDMSHGRDSCLFPKSTMWDYGRAGAKELHICRQLLRSMHVHRMNTADQLGDF